MREKGLLKVLRPKIFGGHETSMRNYFDVVTEISARKWVCRMVYSVKQYSRLYDFLCIWRKSANRNFGANRDNDVILAGNFKPIRIDIEKVDGGYFIKDAQWPFVSGAPYADWFYCGAPVDDGNGGIEMAILIVPREDVKVLDDWDVVGLKGSGSNSIVIGNVFIPDHRVSLDRLASKVIILLMN